MSERGSMYGTTIDGLNTLVIDFSNIDICGNLKLNNSLTLNNTNVSDKLTQIDASLVDLASNSGGGGGGAIEIQELTLMNNFTTQSHGQPSSTAQHFGRNQGLLSSYPNSSIQIDPADNMVIFPSDGVYSVIFNVECNATNSWHACIFNIYHILRTSPTVTRDMTSWPTFDINLVTKYNETNYHMSAYQGSGSLTRMVTLNTIINAQANDKLAVTADYSGVSWIIYKDTHRNKLIVHKLS